MISIDVCVKQASNFILLCVESIGNIRRHTIPEACEKLVHGLVTSVIDWELMSVLASLRAIEWIASVLFSCLKSFASKIPRYLYSPSSVTSVSIPFTQNKIKKAVKN